MGAGKTILIGTIIATEFVMAMAYDNFIKNALVFAPGKTILGSLREITDMEYEKILPESYAKKFLASIKVTYTSDKAEIDCIAGSIYNIVITNTEKIRIQKPTGPKTTHLFDFENNKKLQQKEETVNARLQKIASLPQLGIFSDEGHHTYGQPLEQGLKKVRKTVDYLKDNIVCVINTTGTPYFKRQMLKDVVFWYGLSEGIQDGILKEVKDNIVSFDDLAPGEMSAQIIKDFFANYDDVKLVDGSLSKIALYYPSIDILESSKPSVEQALVEVGKYTSTVWL